MPPRAMRYAILVLLLFCTLAQARDPDGRYANSPFHRWYESQHNANGQWCCDQSDAHPYYGDYAVNADGSVTAEGQKIEKGKVLTGPNPTGHAVWWFVDVGGGRHTYCFAPGTLS